MPRRFLPTILLLIFTPSILLAQTASQPSQEKGRDQLSGNLKKLWNDLADVDGAKAYRAILTLTKTPKETVAFIAGKLEPAVAPDPRKVERLIEDLKSETFAVREKANLELTLLGGLVEAALRKALKGNPELETRQRVERLVDRLFGPITLPDHLRAVRAVEALEYIGTGEAKKLLTNYAAGAPGARLTQDW